MTTSSIHEQLMLLTKHMPCRNVIIDGQLYMQRYFVGTFMDGVDFWLHRFLSADGDRHLHNHSFNAESAVLNGAYVEETPNGMMLREPKQPESGNMMMILISGLYPHIKAPTDIGHKITVFDWHRIDSIKPDTWTAFLVQPQRLPFWHFKDRDGSLHQMETAGRYWWKNRPPRDAAL